MPGHTFLYSPPVNRDPRADRGRRARRDLLHLDEPGEPRPPPAGRQRRLGSRLRTTSRSCATGSTSCRCSVSALSRGCIIPDTPDVAFINLEFPSRDDRPRRAVLARAEQARRTTIVGSRKMVVYDDTSTEPVRIFDSGVTLPIRRRSASTGSPTAPATSSRRASRPRSRSRSRLRTSARPILARSRAAILRRGRPRRRAHDRGGRPLARAGRGARRGGREPDRSLTGPGARAGVLPIMAA